MKTPNLDYRRLADKLIDRGVIANDAMQHVFQECNTHGLLMPEVLVNEGLISDLEIARICTDLFHLPFVPLESYEPSEVAMEGLDQEYLQTYGLVPLDRFGDVMTVLMPCIVPTSVLEGLSNDGSLNILPVVGTVGENRRWLKQNIDSKENSAMEAFNAEIEKEDSSWGDLFDAGDELVQQGLQSSPGLGEEGDLDLEMPSLDLDDMDIEKLSEKKASESVSSDEDLFDLDALDGLDGLDEAV